MGIFLLLLALIGLFYWSRWRSKQGRSARLSKQGEIVQIRAMHQVDRDLPLGNLGVVYRVDSRGVSVVFPKLTSRGAVSYVDRRYDPNMVQRPTLAAMQQEPYRKIGLIAPLIADQFQLEPDTKQLKKLYDELAELQQLAKTSTTQASKVQQLDRALGKISQWLTETDQFQQASLAYIREILIANELEEQDFDSSETRTQLRDQYRTLRQTGHRLQDDAEKQSLRA